MWFETQNCAMMGLQSTCGKRKLEVEVGSGCGTGGIDSEGGGPCSKAARWEVSSAASPVAPITPPAADDCLARLRAVAAVPDCGPWRPSAHHVLSATATGATTPPAPGDDLLDDEDDWDDDLSDYDEPPASQCVPAPTAAAVHRPQYYWQQQYYHHQQQNNHQGHQQQQQTIRRDENGKSYLELGAASVSASSATATSCYRQRRLAVLNLSMCKLARYRQCSDPSLRRSVLICNTLRHIEREMEREGHQQQQNHHHQQQQHHHHHHQPQQQQWYPPSGDTPTEYALRELATPSGRVTPFPHHQQPQSTPTPPTSPSDSGYADSYDDRTINWGSVLSLTAHTDNNNLGLYEEDHTTAMHHHAPADTWDSFVHVLVSGT